MYLWDQCMLCAWDSGAVLRCACTVLVAQARHKGGTYTLRQRDVRTVWRGRRSEGPVAVSDIL